MSDATELRTSSPDLASYRIRRERELSSLYATARSLTALGELDAVLDSIVRAAHELIGTDFTYLSLLGPGGELMLKASQGTISPTFNTARVPSGTGVGGRVIATGAPAWVSNYLKTRDVPHDRSFDDLVAPEGMVALLGVPLLVGDEVIGVLFAADRTERPFEHDEVALLSAFADHAAIALNNARLYDESRSALKQLQAAFRTIEKAQSVHESLTHVVLTGGGADEIARLLVDHLQGAVTVFDRAGAVTARRSVDSRLLPPAGSSPEAVERARRSGRWATTTDGTGRWHSAAAVRAGDTHLGALLLTRTEEPTPVDIRTLERAAQIMGLLVMKETAVAEAEERVNGELLTELLVAVPPVSPAHRARAHARGVDITSLTVIVVAKSETRYAAEIGRRLHAMSAEWNGLGGEHLGRATLLAAASDPAQLARTVHLRLRRELGSPVRVVAQTVTDDDWRRAFETAGRCCDLMRSLGVTDRAATADAYAMFALLFDTDRAQELDRFLADTVQPLLAYDARRSTRLVATLSAYFAHSGNLTRTAGTLHVHMNTLLKRLDRVGSILGPDWREPDRSLQLQVALRLHDLRTQLDRP
ncbi:helix-turn-helix domain-containing protein [Couchioplanes caeruleus]|uniref:helix-turn-helix domain-containing protein n=1 Tax=Couchioplanes caeruleus TaxID=56438 RepID=UPI0020BFF243|nr:GAF domain-containing protein [Couchioplanes caeruleus]UQU67779.1 helix-turn-helix domain-containing protein [Couchioplanes caeruleus]